MKIWLTTDTHFGHDRMLELENRPKGFEDKILQGYSQLQEGDMLVHLGDFCIGQDELWHQRFFKALPYNNTTVLVRGNHDSKSDEWYYNHGWDFVCDSFSLNKFGKKILFTHIPVLYEKELFDVNIHGHLHSNRHHGSPEDFPLQDRIYKLLSIEYGNYKPIVLRTFLKV